MNYLSWSVSGVIKIEPSSLSEKKRNAAKLANFVTDIFLFVEIIPIDNEICKCFPWNTPGRGILDKCEKLKKWEDFSERPINILNNLFKNLSSSSQV